jgi:predicted nucleic acid-binding Zn ribbon protein
MGEPTSAVVRDSDDLHRCASCGFQTPEPHALCPKCGTVMHTRRSARRYGAVLVFIGAFLAIFVGVILWYEMPLLLHPGVEIDGETFTGTPGFGLGVIAGLGGLWLFGVGACAYGIWQIRTGERNLTAVGALVGIASLLYVAGLLVRHYG